ncbi:MAG: alanine--tRNA ligase [Williamsia sp.]|nr:alanine--tRNA ligase [Williamsia sp.]
MANQFSSQQIRETFLDFFRKHDHLLINGSSVIPKNDPTLLFINSGMAPLKKYFLGLETPPHPRLANVQPCIRTNDIEDVGDRHHLTFFEMLGSWSIGDYYKEKAIELAYDLLVNYFKFPAERLYATIYKGNPALNLGPDLEAQRCWEKAGMPPDHIVPMGEDNFWGPAGDTGPCGPCTEVFFDTGDEYGEKYTPGGHFDDVNRYIEIWNAGVFMELNKDKNGQFSPLPMKSVDTGSGIERMFLALNRCNSVYDVDTIKPIRDQVAAALLSEEISERDIRMVTDHMRTATFLLGDGVVPDKEGRGYIARRLIRKSIAATVRAGKPVSLLEEVSNSVINQLSAWYPRLLNQENGVKNLLHQEIADFTPVIQSGLELLNNRLQKSGADSLSGEFIFDLVATHGLPFEVITDYAQKKGIPIDREGYQQEYRTHQEVSRAGIKGKNRVVDGNDPESQLEQALKEVDATEFLGYFQTEGTGTVMAILKENTVVTEATQGETCFIITDRTPFYAESGGQIGDTGTAFNDEATLEITDTRKRKGIFLHTAKVTRGTVATGDELSMQVNRYRRSDIAKNHTSTHLLHAALHEVLGPHAVQKGSLVSNEKLRFDFLHNKPLTADELKTVESKVNRWIWENFSSDIREMDYQSAINTGAMAIFSENYGNRVRVVNFGNVSKELCGGTHVGATGEIGLFMINQEGSVAKGIRRIEAFSGPGAYAQLGKMRDVLDNASAMLAVSPANLVQGIEKLKKSASVVKAAPAAKPAAQQMLHETTIQLPDGAKLFAGQLDTDPVALQQTAEEKIRSQQADLVLLASNVEDSVKTVVVVGEQWQGKYPADQLIRKWLQPFEGRGGGRPPLAKGGIKDPDRTEELIKSAQQAVEGA